MKKSHFFSVLGLLVAFAHPTHAALVYDPGFETTATITTGFATSFDVWSGDIAEIVTGPGQEGISPYEGSQMLQFNYAGRNNWADGKSSSNVDYLFDVGFYSAEIASGQAVVSASAWFNRVSGDAETDSLFQVRLEAYAGAPANINYGNSLARKDGEIITDAVWSTWELATASLLLPVATDYVRLRISAMENVFNDTTGVEFDGQYADNVYVGIGTLSVVPLPGALLLLGSGLGVLGLLGRTRRRGAH